jgi:nitrogen regulatory protein P-II 1
MANLLVLVLHDLDKMPSILKAWKTAGVSGTTVIDSVGMRNLEEYAARDDVPLVPSLRTLFASDETHNRTLFTVIEDDAVLERAIAAAQNIVGDFMQPHTGILFVVPVSRSWGVPKPKRTRKKQ